VLTDFPLKQILHKSKTSGRIIKWAIELREFNLEYVPKHSVKGQAVADFIAEFTDVAVEQRSKKDDLWTFNVDGSANKRCGRAGVIVKSLEGQGLRYAIRLGFKVTNNKAKYEAMIAGLAIATDLGAQNVEIRSDSSAIVGQANGEFEAKKERMQKYLAKVRELMGKLKRVIIIKVPRSFNRTVDQLARLVAASEDELESSREQIRLVHEPSIAPTREVAQIGAKPSWAESIIRFLEDGSLPEDRKEAKKIRVKAAKYTILQGMLYKRGQTLPLLKCVSLEEGAYILNKIHEGVCGSHTGGRILGHKVVRMGYYWPNMYAGSMEVVRKCKK
jgi:ribonuclease HI